MEISLRSRMTAGTFAVVGATAIAVTPMAQPALISSAQREASSAMVALTALNSPITALVDTVQLATSYLFSNASPQVAANWPYSNFGATFGPVPGNIPGFIPAFVLPTAAAGGYTAVGVVPQIINDGLPIISQLGVNARDYITTTLNAFVQAGLDILSLQIADAATVLLQAGTYVLQGVVTRAGAVLNSVVGELPQLATLAVAHAAVLLGTTRSIITSFTTALGNGDVEGAYNAIVDGFLAPSGLPGTLLNLTIGAGLQVAPIPFPPNPAVIATSFVPSWRTAIQAGVKLIASDLATPNPAPPVPPPLAATKSAARSAAAIRKAAPAVAAVSSDSSAAPEAVTAASDNNSGGDQPSAKSSRSHGGSDRGASKASKHSAD